MQFVVTVRDAFAGRIVTKVMDDWRRCIGWAKAHSIDGLAVIRDQRIDEEYWLDLSDPMIEWMYA